MDHQEAIKQLRFDYYGVLEDTRKADEKNHTNYAAYFLDFYDYLLRRGYNRHQLSALGISRKNALGDC